jgi:hypothetical protein
MPVVAQRVMLRLPSLPTAHLHCTRLRRSACARLAKIKLHLLPPENLGRQHDKVYEQHPATTECSALDSTEDIPDRPFTPGAIDICSRQRGRDAWRRHAQN